MQTCGNARGSVGVCKHVGMCVELLVCANMWNARTSVGARYHPGMCVDVGVLSCGNARGSGCV